MHVAHAVHERCGLFGDRGRHRGIAVPDRGDAEGRRQVDVAIAVDVFNRRAAGRLPKHREVVADIGDVARFVSTQRGGERARVRTGYVAHDAFEVVLHALVRPSALVRDPGDEVGDARTTAVIPTDGWTLQIAEARDAVRADFDREAAQVLALAGDRDRLHRNVLARKVG